MAIKINTRPVAQKHATGETIVEYSSPSGGGLISFQEDGEGGLRVHLYRHDETVQVTTSGQGGF
jgi:hypothetical protein